MLEFNSRGVSRVARFAVNYRVLTTVSALALAAGSFGFAQSAHAQADANGAAASTETVVVTGSLITRTGYQAPTPLTVLDQTALQQQPSANVADYLNTVPAFSGNQSPSSTHGISAGTNGVNVLNLRDLGFTRTLVLLDGQRAVGSLQSGAVDVNDFPQQLIQRVDVVTGGASAVYGSDAVAGVANFILDKTYTGFKADISAGITNYADDKTFDLSLTDGFDYAGGRGHVLLSVSESDKAGIPPGPSRPWISRGWGIMVNPNYTATNGQPYYLKLPDVSTDVTYNGVIFSGPLKGTAFGPGGSVYQFHYGSLVSGTDMAGGDWQDTQVQNVNGPSLDTADSRQNVFTRIAYDVTDDINVYAQISWARTRSATVSVPNFYLGNFPLIQSGNPFIPASVQAAMTANGLTNINVATFLFDTPDWGADDERTVNRNVLGTTGKFSVLGTNWNWDAYYENAWSISSVDAEKVIQKSRVTLAADAVANPAVGGVAGVAVGAPVCRSTLTNPTNGCVPLNPFGSGVNGSAVKTYLFGATDGNSLLHQTLTESVWAGTLTGEPFSIWAGPVSVAMNVAHRIESANGHVDPTSAALDWFGGNASAVIGSFNVTEGAFETVVPIANGVWWADNWDFNGAVRFTDYSTSGFVTTWKVGTTYSPIPDIKFRATQSRDIRAPGLQELYATLSASSQGTIIDYSTNPAGTSYTAYGLSSGNPNLKPEVAANTTVGVVLQPSFLPGLSASVDYWFVKIKGGIVSIGRQDAVNLCQLQNNPAYCSYIIRNPSGAITGVKVIPTNAATQRADGLDFDATYTMSASDIISSWDGDLTLHALATKNIENVTNSGIPGTTPTEIVAQDSGGVTGSALPDWRLTSTLSYVTDTMTAALTARAVSPGVYNTSYVQCSSGCPVATVANRTINDNHIAGAVYFDLAYAYRFGMNLMGSDTDAEAYLNVRNIFNSSPVVVAPSGARYFAWPTDNAVFDSLGMVFRTGIRIHT